MANVANHKFGTIILKIILPSNDSVDIAVPPYVPRQPKTYVHQFVDVSAAKCNRHNLRHTDHI